VPTQTLHRACLPACLPACLLALQRLLDYIKPDKVHIMQDGRIVTTGDMGLVDKLELEGYSVLSKR
jgi:Fe-S cluster assembly ATPase SufC